MSIFRRFFVGASYSTLTAVINRILLAVGSIIFARYLGASEFGVYVNLLAVVNLFSVICLFGVNVAFSAFVPQYNATAREKIPAVVLSGLSLVCVVLLAFTGFVAVAAGLIAESLYQDQVPATYLLLALPWLMGVTLNTAAFSALYGFQDFRYYALVNIFSGALVALLSISGVLLFGLSGLVLGNAVAYVISFAAALASLVRYDLPWSFDWQSVKTSLREMFGFALPTFLSGLVVAPAFWIGNMLIVQSGDIAESGYFGVAFSMAQFALLIPTTLSAPLVPIFSEVSSTQDNEKFSALVTKNVKMIWSITLPVVVLLGSSAAVLVVALYGNQYAPSIPTFIVLVATNLLAAVEGILGYILIARKKMWDAFFVNMIWFMMFVVLALVMIPRNGHLGFAIAMLIAYGVFGIVIVAFLKRHIVFSIMNREFASALAFTVLAIALMLTIAFSVKSTPLILTSSILLALFVVALEWKFFLSLKDRAMVTDTVEYYLSKYVS